MKLIISPKSVNSGDGQPSKSQLPYLAFFLITHERYSELPSFFELFPPSPGLFPPLPWFVSPLSPLCSASLSVLQAKYTIPYICLFLQSIRDLNWKKKEKKKVHTHEASVLAGAGKDSQKT